MLHNDQSLFEQVILRVSEDTGIEASIIEKDYYVTLFLQRIVEQLPNIIFKGGTSLSKCYKLINRFSEDIDLNMDTETHPTEGQRKRLKEVIVSIIGEFGFALTNPDQVRSRRDYNRYLVDYPTIFPTSYLKEHLIVETAVYIKAYPCKRMLASSLIHDYLKRNGYTELIEQYGLQPFELNVQTAERTLVDTCSFCSHSYQDSYTDQLAHSYSYAATKNPTVNEGGILTGTCSKCSHKTTVNLPKLNTTDYDYKETKAATCAEDGAGEYTWKTTTYGTFKFTVSIGKTNHSYSYAATKNPTVNEGGTLTGTCSKCSHKTTVNLPKLNTTDYDYKETKAATCAEDGVGEYTWKTTTYGTFMFTVDIPKTEHDYSYAVTQEPAAEAAGVLTGTCSGCANTVTVELPVLNTTDYTYTVIQDPADGQPGIGQYTWNTDTYGTFSFEVTLDQPEVTLVSIEIASAPEKTVYQIGESLDLTGLTLNAVYSDGSNQTITEGFEISGFDANVSGEQSIEVSFVGMTVSFTVTVMEAVSEEEPQIVVSNKNGSAGQQVEITVSLQNNPGIASMQLTLKYDAERMTLISVADTGNLGEAVHSDNYSACPYILSWVNDLATSNYTFNGDIVTLTFQIAEDAIVGECPVTVSCDESYAIYNVDGEEVKFATVDGYVNIMDVLIGDVNTDGRVNAQDRLLLTRYLAKWTGYTEDMINMTAADVNCDGKVNAQDRLILTRHLAKWTGYESLGG